MTRAFIRWTRDGKAIERGRLIVVVCDDVACFDLNGLTGDEGVIETPDGKRAAVSACDVSRENYAAELAAAIAKAEAAGVSVAVRAEKEAVFEEINFG